MIEDGLIYNGFMMDLSTVKFLDSARLSTGMLWVVNQDLCGIGISNG